MEAVGTYTGYAELSEVLEEYKDKASVHNPLNQCDMSEAIDYVNKNIGGAVPTFMFSFLDSDGIKYNKLKRDETINGISSLTDICLILNNITPSNMSFGSDATKKKAENIFDGYECASAIVNHLYTEEARTYNIISATNYEPITLDQPITYASKTASDMLSKKPDLREQYRNFADTDKDGLYDFEEINFENDMIKFDTAYGTAIMPTFAECAEYKRTTGNCVYVDVGLERYKAQLLADDLTLPAHRIDIIINSKPVLPINSDPVDPDGDNDGMIDMCDSLPLNHGNKLQYINSGVVNENTHFVTFNKIIEKNFRNTGIKVISDTAKVYNLPVKDDSRLISTLSKGQQLTFSSIVWNDEAYWFKIKLENGLAGYVNAADVQSEELSNEKRYFEMAVQVYSVIDEYVIYGEFNLASQTMPELTGYERPYEPDVWNNNSFLKSENCYAYALNIKDLGERLQPGDLYNKAFKTNYKLDDCKGDSSKDCYFGYAIQLLESVLRDAYATNGYFGFKKPNDENINYYSVALVFGETKTLVYKYQYYGIDYHWYRRDKNVDTWSHKPGKSNVKNTDNSNKEIYDPKNADRYSNKGEESGQQDVYNYTEFVGYFYVGGGLINP